MEGMITREGTRRTRKGDPDDEILVLLGRGDPEAALRLLMERYGADVYRLCCRMLRDKSLADDVRQRVFIEAYRDLPRFEGRSSMRTWLFAIAHHRAYDAAKMRRRILDAESAQPTDTPDPRPSPAESLDEMRLRQVLADSLEDLSEHVRVTVLLRFQHGLTYEEIASMSGESVSAAHARVFRGLQRLRHSIEGRIGDLEQLRR